MEKVVEQLKESWCRCYQKRLSKKLSQPQEYVGKKELQKKKRENRVLIQVFMLQAKRLAKQYCSDNPLFLLTDPEGILISSYYSDQIAEKVQQAGIKEGVYFTEESCGTNAISLAMETGGRIYLKGDDHYCYFFQDWECIASPIKINKKVIGYLDISTLHKKLEENATILFELLLTKIITELKDRLLFPGSNKPQKTILTHRRLEILRLSAMGYNIEEISQKLNTSQENIKYHRKKIRQQLGAKNFTHAIFKAIKLEYLDLKEIESN